MRTGQEPSFAATKFRRMPLLALFGTPALAGSKRKNAKKSDLLSRWQLVRERAQAEDSGRVGVARKQGPAAGPCLAD
jgi:hypothetical protein